MTLLDRVNEAIEANKGARYLIMRPEAREELKFELAEAEGKEITDVLTDILKSYRGKTVAISEKETFPDFVLC